MFIVHNMLNCNIKYNTTKSTLIIHLCVFYIARNISLANQTYNEELHLNFSKYKIFRYIELHMRQKLIMYI